MPSTHHQRVFLAGASGVIPPSRYWRSNLAIWEKAGAATTPPQIAPWGSSTETRITRRGRDAGTIPTKDVGIVPVEACPAVVIRPIYGFGVSVGSLDQQAVRELAIDGHLKSIVIRVTLIVTSSYRRKFRERRQQLRTRNCTAIQTRPRQQSFQRIRNLGSQVVDC